MTENDERRTRPSQPRRRHRELEQGSLVGDYRIVRVIASGGWGSVYEAVHELLGRRAALKVIHPDLAAHPKNVERFVREAQAVNLIAHQNIVDIYEFGNHQGRPYYVMEYLEGASLEDVLRQRGRIGMRECLELIEPICAALEAAHRVGVVHRDLKAGNIHVSEAEGARRVTLLDFGIAKFLDRSEHQGLTSAGTTLGTPDAMAPEQVRGEATDARTDVYALGVLLFQMVTGRVPYRGATPLEVEQAHCEAPIPRASVVAATPEALDPVLARAMAKQAEDRYPSVTALLEALRQVVVAGNAHDATDVEAGPKAVGIYLEVSAASMNDELAVLDTIADMMDGAEEILGESGYAFPLSSSSSLLAVRLVTDGIDESRQKAIQRAIALYDELHSIDSRVEITVCVHVDDATVATSTRGASVVGGAITRLARWPLSKCDVGVHVTPGAVPPSGTGRARVVGD